MGEEGQRENVTGLTEAEHIRLAQQGESKSYDWLVERHRKQVYRWAYQLVRAHDLADEVTQDVFVRTYHALDRIDPERPLGAWLCRSTTNIALNLLRKHQYRTKRVEEDRPEPSDFERAASEPDAVLRRRRVMRWVEAAIDALPPMYRAVIFLRVKEDMSYQEIATALDISIGTVMSRLARARRKLRKALGDIVDELAE